MSIRASICQTRGDDSQSWKNNFPKDICGLVGYWQKFKRQLDQVTCGQKYGRKLVKPLRIEKTQNGKHEMGESIVRKSKVKPASQQLCFRVLMNVVSAKPSTSAPQQFAIEMCSFCMTVLCVKLSSTCIAATLPRMTDSQAWLGKELWWCLHHSKFGQQLVFMNDHFTHQSTLMSCLWQQTRSYRLCFFIFRCQPAKALCAVPQIFKSELRIHWLRLDHGS